MLFGEIYDLIVLKLREDFDRPEFWKEFEIFTYMKLGVNKVITDTSLILNDAYIPMAPVIEAGVEIDKIIGIYELSPLLYKNRLKINQIKSIYWRYDIMNGVYDRVLTTLRPFEIEQIDPSWRTKYCQYGEKPTHAILHGGNVDAFGDNNDGNLINASTYELSGFAKPKIHLYPKPYLNDEQIAQLTEYSEIVTQFNAGTENGIALTDDTTGDAVIDFNDDDDGDISIEEPGYETDALIVRMEEVVGNLAGISPFIMYKPRFDIDYSSESAKRKGWRNIDMSFLSDELQLSIIDYVRAQAFDKEGQTNNLTKSMHYASQFGTAINEGKTENFVQQRIKKKKDKMYP